MSRIQAAIVVLVLLAGAIGIYGYLTGSFRSTATKKKSDDELKQALISAQTPEEFQSAGLAWWPAGLVGKQVKSVSLRSKDDTLVIVLNGDYVPHDSSDVGSLTYDLKESLHVIADSHLKFGTVELKIFAQGFDLYGNPADIRVADAYWKRSELAKVNWQNIDPDNLLIIGKVSYLCPELSRPPPPATADDIADSVKEALDNK